MDIFLGMAKIKNKVKIRLDIDKVLDAKEVHYVCVLVVKKGSIEGYVSMFRCVTTPKHLLRF